MKCMLKGIMGGFPLKKKTVLFVILALILAQIVSVIPGNISKAEDLPFPKEDIYDMASTTIDGSRRTYYELNNGDEYYQIDDNAPIYFYNSAYYCGLDKYGSIWIIKIDEEDGNFIGVWNHDLTPDEFVFFKFRDLNDMSLDIRDAIRLEKDENNLVYGFWTVDDKFYNTLTLDELKKLKDILYPPSPSPSPAKTKKPSTTKKPAMTENPSQSKAVRKGYKIKAKGLLYQVTHISKNGTGEVMLQGIDKNFDRNPVSLKIGNTLKIKGKSFKITSIGKNAFKNCRTIKSVTLGKNIARIGKQAFYGCKKLKRITFKTTRLKSKTVGSMAFKGIDPKAKVIVPKGKRKTYQKILKARGAQGKAMTFI